MRCRPPRTQDKSGRFHPPIAPDYYRNYYIPFAVPHSIASWRSRTFDALGEAQDRHLALAGVVAGQLILDL
jgi:hypothetical protein